MTAVGIIYLWLEYRASIYLWIAGIIMPAIYIFIYYDAGLYADFGINIYYLLIALYGWIVWKTGFTLSGKKKKSGELPISRPQTRVAAHSCRIHCRPTVHYIYSDKLHRQHRTHCRLVHHRAEHYRNVDARPQIHRAMVGVVHCRCCKQRTIHTQRTIFYRSPLCCLCNNSYLWLPQMEKNDA